MSYGNSIRPRIVFARVASASMQATKFKCSSLFFGIQIAGQSILNCLQRTKAEA